MPVSGWNQCVKCEAPCSTAQSLRAEATASAVEVSRASPRMIVSRSALYAGLGNLACWTLSLNTSAPNVSFTLAGVFVTRPSVMAQLRMPLIASPNAAEPMRFRPFWYDRPLDERSR